MAAVLAWLAGHGMAPGALAVVLGQAPAVHRRRGLMPR
eukprot:SAG25_NODE_10460_length_333_cov_0.884615_1_plen_37_part_01